MSRKLSTIERMIDGNITYTLALEGEVDHARLRGALSWLQRRHPALRMLIREERGELYYEDDCAPEIPLRVCEGADAAAVARERQAELYAPFAYDQPQLRLVWLRGAEGRHVLLIVANHRICDGMSMLTITRELLRAFHAEQEPATYTQVTVQDIIGDFDDGKRGRRKLLAFGLNALLRVLPVSRKPPDNREHHLIEDLSIAMTAALKQRCRSEGVSMHAALMAALGDAFAALGNKRAPDWVESPMDARRGRLSMLKEDMLFFGGGSLKLSAKPREGSFWERAKDIHAEVRRKIDEELEGIPSRYQLCEMITPPSAEKMRGIVRLGDRLSRNGNWNLFSLSNLGNLSFEDPQSPLRVTDFAIHVHSFTTRLLGFLVYAMHGRMRFILISDEKCLRQDECATLWRSMKDSLARNLGMGVELHGAALPELSITAG